MRRIWWLALVTAGVCVGASSVPDTEKYWVFFKDKGITSVRSALAARVRSLPPSVARRWERAGWHGDEGDLRVSREYVREVEGYGIPVLRESRWLNAISARLTSEQRRTVIGLRCVSEIVPVARYVRQNDQIEALATREDAAGGAAPYGFNYGPSLHQWEMVQVPSMHDLGFQGSGVTICMMDTGFMKSHDVFSSTIVQDEYDFVFDDGNTEDEAEDLPGAQGHGTGTWSLTGGKKNGRLIGASFGARFLLAKTEDIRSETVVEEDNWVAALEWADERGVDIVSSSLGYSDWYSPEDYDGNTAITSKVASQASKRGILVVNSAGNAGPALRTLNAPADAFGIISTGALNPSGPIAAFSSRGPTADGRTKPEVCAQGVNVLVASSFNSTAYGRGAGTSFSCPITAGAVGLLLSARQDWSPSQLREAVLTTATGASSPDNTYGWGTVQIFAAYRYLPRNALEIDHKPLADQSASAGGYRVKATLRAYNGINQAQCFVFYRTAAGAAFTRIGLTKLQDDRFAATIPRQPAGTEVDYYIQAKDTLGRLRRRPYEAPAETYGFEVR
ncbi:MAG: S8 family serine peptidase [Acidobacteriota bacterium]